MNSNEKISLRIVNNTSFPQNISILGGESSNNPNVDKNNLVQWDITGETFSNNTVILNLSTPITTTMATLDIQGAVNALNSLNVAFFYYVNDMIFAKDILDPSLLSATLQLGTAIPVPVPFFSTWNTANTSGGSSASNQVKLPLEATGNYNFTVDWGDGSPIDTITVWNQSETTHTYSTSGTYNISIEGTIEGFAFTFGGDRNKITSITNWGDLRLGNSGNYFFGCNNLDISSVTDVLDLTGTTTLENMFNNCFALTTINNINSWDISGITNLTNTFSDCTNFNSDISSWVVSNVTIMQATFLNCSSFNSNIGSWNVANVTDMGGLFNGCTVFNQDIGSWNVGLVTNFTGAFGLMSAFNQDIGSWNVSSALSMNSMFILNTSFNQNLNSWNTSNVTNMGQMFQNATSFDGTITNWDITSNTNFLFMFNGASSFNQDLNLWDMSNATNLFEMFSNATSFNGNITNWNVSNVTVFYGMFNGASSFNQNIGSWNVANSTNHGEMFRDAISFNQDISSWNVANSNNMQQMFNGANSFDQNIGSWDISGVASLTDFMASKTPTTFSASNLDAIYNGWSALPSLQSGVFISFGTAKYTSSSSAGRSILTSPPNNWTVTDGGIATAFLAQRDGVQSGSTGISSGKFQALTQDINGDFTSISTPSFLNFSFCDYVTSFDITTLNEINSVGFSAIIPSGLAYSNDGLKLFLNDTAFSLLRQFDLVTPYNFVGNLSSSTAYPLGVNEIGEIRFSNDGLSLFIVNEILPSQFAISKISLNTAFVGSSMNALVQSFTPAVIGFENGFDFSDNGNELYIVASNKIYKYTLSTNYDLSTTSLVGEILDPQINNIFNAGSVVVNTTQNKLYVAGQQTAAYPSESRIGEYDLSLL